MGKSRDVSGKVAVITGGASGIGRALTLELARRGAFVVAADRQAPEARDVITEVERAGGRGFSAELDVRDLDAQKALAQRTVEEVGRVDFLFNNAGIGVGGEIAKYEPADWDDVFDVNLRGVAYGIQAFYPIMIRQESGHIINTASVAGLITGAVEGSYGATKHAVVGLSKTLRVEGKRHGVRSSALCPGAIRTPILTGGRYGRMNVPVGPEKIMKQWERVRPMDPTVFAKKAIDAVLANEAIIVIPSWWKLAWYLERISPSAGIGLWSLVFGQMQRELDI
jgi:NAD(P)-dependent dehydrogenase (short-subunit alcohol dehydrogenase family)